MDSLYQKDETHKMASQKATEKLKATASVKGQASSTIYVDDLIFIKEGTLLGRTITDFQLIEEYRGESGGYSKYRTVKGEEGEEESKTGSDEKEEKTKTRSDEKEEEHKADSDKKEEEPKTDSDKKEEESKTDSEEEDENTDAVIGNYLRIILRDLDDSVVENAENYMKLFEEGKHRNSECDFEQLAYFLGCLEEGFYERMDNGTSYGVEVLADGAGNTTAFGLTSAVAGLPTVKETYPSFASHLAAGSVPKEEAQDVFILVLEAAKEEIQNRLNTPLEDDDSSLFALIDLSHASPAECYKVIDVYNAKNNNLSSAEMMSVFSEHWGSNMNYAEKLMLRGRNRGWLASEGRFFLYQAGSEGDEVIFDSETPWTEFCDAGGTFEMTKESSGLYHVEKGVDSK